VSGAPAALDILVQDLGPGKPPAPSADLRQPDKHPGTYLGPARQIDLHVLSADAEIQSSVHHNKGASVDLFFIAIFILLDAVIGYGIGKVAAQRGRRPALWLIFGFACWPAALGTLLVLPNLDPYNRAGSLVPVLRIVIGALLLTGGIWFPLQAATSSAPTLQAEPSRVTVSTPQIATVDSDRPTAGDIWFGSSYDTTTFAVHGRTTTATVSDSVALVAALSSPASDSVRIEITSKGHLPFVQPYAIGKNWDVVALMVPFGSWGATTGTYSVTVTDTGGNVLAAGVLMIQ
jgi:hypothetical protein